MTVAGIVAEYNPFHSGHALHIRRTREAGADHIAAVMSGNFVQRGEPALFPKAARVAATLAGGVDLILELPTAWALSSAERFGFGAVSILDRLGCVDLLSFGSEAGDTAALNQAAAWLDRPEFITKLKDYMGQGITYAAASEKAMAGLAGEETGRLLASPNDTLGIAYIRALNQLDSNITPLAVPREGAAHDGSIQSSGICSASYIRELARAGEWEKAADYMPPEAYEILTREWQAGHAVTGPAIDRAVLAKLRGMRDFSKIAGASEGLENRLAAAVKTAGSLRELEEAVKTKRYPLSRIRRLIWSAALNIPAGMMASAPPYVRVLGLNQLGEEILAAAKCRIVSRASEMSGPVWELECRASDWYGLATAAPMAAGREYTDRTVKL